MPPKSRKGVRFGHDDSTEPPPPPAGPRPRISTSKALQNDIEKASRTAKTAARRKNTPLARHIAESVTLWSPPLTSPSTIPDKTIDNTVDNEDVVEVEEDEDEDAALDRVMWSIHVNWRQSLDMSSRKRFRDLSMSLWL
ncbi:hypothetical protein EJ05DRAFT_490717 [Pseudovirgaria hyperparasitica]|uniref:Uncharacterized protein n=1 Tax=Pseudovirgaria hyperparasitica TaxID=470096 RepID=A0A6A6VSD6_9PEZI|nr:uncharacterized protein EJ05DRAFT_490717 [Pseudovirgaria hyperparasitica]KAF2752696.1 hypothetical protein EJ05DRAFT_490717 [Pseudovirgaria hyperparasitica]